MKKFTAQVISVHSGSNKDSSKDEHPSIQVELNGIVGDAHQSYERKAWAGGDKQPEGTVRRNERQWSAVSVEELAEISAELDLTEDISAPDGNLSTVPLGKRDSCEMPEKHRFAPTQAAEISSVRSNSAEISASSSTETADH